MAGKGFPLKVVLEAIDKLSGPVMHAASTVRKLGTAAAGVRGTFSSLSGRMGVPVFTASLKEAGKRFGEFRELAGGAVRTLRNVAAGLAVVATSTLFATNAYAEYTGKIHDQVKVTGLSAESLQAWGFAAKQNGIEAEAFYSAMKVGSKNIGLAAVGQGKAKDVLKGLGIQIKDTTGKFRSMDAMLPEIADKIRKLKTPQLQAAAASQIFGKSGADLLPFLLEGSDGIKALSDRARELGLVLSGDAIEQGDRLGDTMDEVKGSLLGVRNTIFAQLAPVIIDLAKRFTDFVIQNKPQIEAFAKTLAERLPAALDQIGAAFSALWAIISPFISVLSFLNDVFGLQNLILGVLAVTVGVKVTQAIIALTTAFRVLGLAFLATPIGWIVAGLTGLALVATAVYNNWDKVKQWWRSFVDWLTPKIKWLADHLYLLGPLGMAAQAGMKLYDMATGGNDQAPAPAAATVGPQAAQAGRPGDARVTVDLNNLPAGTRVSSESDGLAFDLNQGYALAAP